MSISHTWLATVALLIVSAAPCVAADAAPNNTVYEAFVRTFAEGGDGNPSGDFKGLIKKLNYLNDGNAQTSGDLGIGILWLMPIFPAGSYHGYDVTDYRNVNPDFGTLSDFTQLLQQAHQRGIRVILDIPFNHTSAHHEWFKDAVQNGPHRPWYLMGPDDGQSARWWSTTVDADGNRIKYFSLFGSNMPDLDFDTTAVRDEVKAIAKFWLDRGVDGFRLDAAKHIYGWTDKPTEGDIQKNNAWWRSFSDFVYSIKPDAVLVGEVLGEERMLIRHARGLNALIDETFMKGARAEIQHPHAGFLTHWKQVVQSATAENPAHTYNSFTFLASHDQNPRLASELEQNTPATAVQRYRLGMCILMSASRCPILYQGDELMQRGWKWNGNSPTDPKNPGDGSHIYDETLREPVPWTADDNGPADVKWQPPGHPGFLPKYDRPNDGVSFEEENADHHSVLSLVRALTNLRERFPAFANGELGDVLSDTPDWLAFERVTGDQHFLVLVNPTPQANTYALADPQWRQSETLFWADGQSGATGAGGQIQNDVKVAAFGMMLLRRAGR